MISTRKVRRIVSGATLTATALTLTTSCGGGPGTATADGGKARVIGAFYPMAWIAERVGGASVSVHGLTKPGAEPHDLELTPRQVAEVGEAKYVVYVKGVQPAVDEAVAQHAKGRSLDAASVVKTLPPAEAEAEHGEEEHGEEEHGHETSYDPHIWLDPSRLATIATTLGDRLADVDSAHAAEYRANAASLNAELNALDREFASGLRQCGQKTFVTSHAAFGYLADRYGVTQVSIAGVDPQNEPSPKRLAELTRVVRDNKVSTIFTETLVSPKVAQTLAREAGVRTASLDPLEGVAEGSKDDYLSVMRRNLQALRTALSCT
ncbi:metal ABC transporter substrate-binding protein [Actinomadura sp. HBU206391]|uniref:metal ABC transporter substrate-binding protein n=1 Tax=Actinomadura sp. HBU206391 TaxID=2731692 RepID=UPI00164F558F|nr:metal ABC transporter substrate-binding protein [Actinomadura sp. HBU206391]MBC6461626.1 zinc ABC transporter substrate-binding protein [Actinomadura sp. HBU206391]